MRAGLGWFSFSEPQFFGMKNFGWHHLALSSPRLSWMVSFGFPRSSNAVIKY
jgi:hypothetical protein